MTGSSEHACMQFKSLDTLNIQGFLIRVKKIQRFSFYVIHGMNHTPR